MTEVMKAIGKSLLYFALYIFIQAICTEIIFPGNELLASSLSGGIFIGAIWLIYKKCNIDFCKRIEIRKMSWKKVGMAVMLAIIVCLAIQSLQLLFPVSLRQETYETAENMLSSNMLENIFAAIIVAPAVEEFLLRGLIFGTLKKAMPVWVAAILQAVIFGSLHGTLLWGVIAALIAVFYAFLMQKYKSILAPWLGHLANNIIALIVSF